MKLKLIRSSLFALVLSYSFICHAQKHPDFSYNKSANPWVTAFKDQVFVYSLKTAYQSDSTIFKLLERKDAFNPYDGLDLKALNKARLLGKKIIDEMPANPAMCENCLPGMNYYLATALHYYASKELDSIAKSEYKKQITTDKKFLAKPQTKTNKKRPY